MSVRTRLLLLVATALVVGYLWITWSVVLGLNLVHAARNGGYTSCPSPGWKTLGTGCGTAGFSETRGWILLLVVGTVVGGAGLVAARWVTLPIRALATTVGRLGPQNFGERIPYAGRDATGRVAAETNALLERMVEAYESQRRFAANASHELRTPLAVQRTLIEVGMADVPSPEQAELLARQLLDANRRNEELVEGLLVLAETDRGLVSSTPQRLDAITAAVCDRHAAVAERAGLTLTCRTAPTTVSGEEVMIERLVTNLVQNAIKYNADGGTVTVVVEDEAVAVGNTGPSVPAESIPRLFEPFRRAHGERLDTRGGSGLGLTIVRSIAAAHRASVVAVPNPGGGLLVTVRF